MANKMKDLEQSYYNRKEDLQKEDERKPLEPKPQGNPLNEEMNNGN